MREPNTEEMTMSKFYAAVGGDLSDVLERLEDLDIVKFYLPEFKNTTISLLPEIYPAGDEIVTIYETTGRIVKPGNLPISVGVTVYNVETMLNAYYAIKEGKGIHIELPV